MMRRPERSSPPSTCWSERTMNGIVSPRATSAGFIEPGSAKYTIGRAARMLATLMALQAGLPLLDFRVVAEERKKAYFAAVQAALDRNYRPMERVFAEVIERTLAAS